VGHGVVAGVRAELMRLLGSQESRGEQKLVVAERRELLFGL